MQDRPHSGAPPTHDNFMAQLEKRLGKRFAFISLLGQGSAGTVFEVKNLSLDRREALKILAEAQPPSFSARFAHEAKVSAALDHPCIVKIHEYGRDEGLFWYSMQFIEGPSLAQMMTVQGRMDQTSMARLAIPLLDALHYSHNHGVVHRDIKPGNILINEEGRPFLTDFGIAKTAESMVKTRTGMMVGTPAYVSPEQALGQVVDNRSDIYSMGVTLYEMLSRRLPFIAENSLQTVVMRCKEDPEPLLNHCNTVNPALAAVIMRALCRDKEQRWANAAQMREAMIEACELGGIAWNQPLEGVPNREIVQESLSMEESEILSPLTDDGWSEIKEDRGRRAWLKSIRWPWFAAAAAVLLAILVLSFRFRGNVHPKPPMTPPSQNPVQAVIPPLVPSVLPTVQPPQAPGKPAPRSQPDPPSPKDALPRRAMTPPLMEESSQPDPQSAQHCSGLTVNLSLRVGEDGSVKSCKVLSKVKEECSRAACEAGMRHRFKPALDAKGQPVESSVAIALVFPETP